MALYSVVTWIVLFAVSPVHDDVRHYYLTAEIGLRHGWPHIYDQQMLRDLAGTVPGANPVVDANVTFASTPVLAWLFAPLTLLPVEAVYVIWTVLSLAALVLAWRLAAPYSGLAKVTLLLVALGLWPVLLTLYFGQPTLMVVACVAASWWLATTERPYAAGAALVLATFLKPQAVILLPLVLLVSGRYRIVAAWAGGSAVLGLVTMIALGPTGLAGWWHAVRDIQNLPFNRIFTLAGLLGLGPLTYFLWVVQGAIAVFVAWQRRSELEIVFAAGILGTVATATYYHNSDYSVLVLPAWLVLRTAPAMWHRVWLLAGILPMQLLLTPLNAGPQLIWDAGWLAILAVEALPALHAKAVPSEVVMTTRGTDQAARRVGL